LKATLTFTLPDDEAEFDYALAGRDALIALQRINNWARELVKYGEITDDVRTVLEQLRRDKIPHELVEKLR
jgi:hypothetical protein